jgi:hypothetical protein
VVRLGSVKQAAFETLLLTRPIDIAIGPLPALTSALEEAKRGKGVAPAPTFAVAPDVRAMRGTGVNVGHFKASVHVTLWS